MKAAPAAGRAVVPRWVLPFVTINTFVVAVAWASKWLGDRGTPAALWLAAAARDSAVVLALTLATRGKRRIDGRQPPGRAAALKAWAKLLCVAAPADVAIYLATVRWGLVQREPTDSQSLFEPRGGAAWAAAQYVHFVALSFSFEVIFDLLHYASHRACHSVPRLRSAHATHHRHSSGLGPISTYEQSASDVAICNVAPALGALWAVAQLRGALSDRDFALLWAYKAYVECAGHCGVESRATSFPQCVWLPRWLGIALRTADHDRHHHHGRPCNFAKRFTLWDRCFGTYVPSA